MPSRIVRKINQLVETHKNPAVFEPFHRTNALHCMTTLINESNTIRLPLKHGSFNAGLIKFPHKNEYICVYRPDETSFTGIRLNSKLEIFGESYKFKLTNCADPRLIWDKNKLLVIYSSIEEGFKLECIKGSIIMDLAKSDDFISTEPFRVSPKSTSREKNWMPFSYQNKIYLTASVNPHVIYELKEQYAEKVYENDFVCPWINNEFLRGNTNAVQLEDGNYLGTFHTVKKNHKNMHFYDNGCYVFEGKPPFKVLKCSYRTYMKAEDAIEPHFRKKGLIQVCFPVGMIRNDDEILISYGDNDSCVKILKTTVKEMLSTTIDVY